MAEFQRDRAIGGDFVRTVRLALSAAVVSMMLAACGGGSDSPAAATGGTGASPVNNGGIPTVPSAGAGESAAAAGEAVSDESVPARVASARGATTLSWTAPTMTEEGTPLNLKGYRIYWGPTEGYYPFSVTLDNPGLTRYVVEELAPATWYFVATALSDSGESEFSNVIAMKVL